MIIFVLLTSYKNQETIVVQEKTKKDMNQTPSKVYIFIDYNDLQQLDVCELGEASTRIFVFIDGSTITSIPLIFVQRIQHLGKKVRWISEKPHVQYHFDMHIAFLLGKLDERIGKKTQFAVFSNSDSYNNIIEKLNKGGRASVRYEVKNFHKQKKTSNKLPIDTETDDDPFFSKKVQTKPIHPLQELKNIRK